MFLGLQTHVIRVVKITRYIKMPVTGTVILAKLALGEQYFLGSKGWLHNFLIVLVWEGTSVCMVKQEKHIDQK